LDKYFYHNNEEKVDFSIIYSEKEDYALIVSRYSL
jgi:hypothetical protein